MFTRNLQIHIVTCCIHLHIHHTSRTPYLFHSFSDFVVYVVTTLTSPNNQRQCASFSVNVAILFLSSKRAQQIDRQLALQTSEKEITDRIPFTLTFHPHNHAAKSIIFKTLNYSKRSRDCYYLFANPLISFKRGKNIGNLLMIQYC